MEDVPRGVHINFLKAERSLHRWALEDLQRIHSAEDQAVEEGGGVEMHVLEDAGHWVCFKSLAAFVVYLLQQRYYTSILDSFGSLFARGKVSCSLKK